MASVPDTIGNYRLVAKIACGSFGCVYRSEHKTLKNRIVAIKLMHNAHLNSQQEQEVFLEEAHLLAMLDHPHILPILDVGIDDGFPYLITEYAPNGSLQNRLKREPGKPLPMQEALTVLSQIGQAVHHAHEQGIVHRDLKPENILFKANGDVLLADFGIAKVLATAGFRQGTIIGTPPYMAPEQFGGTASKEGDQYALGCIAYELFTGQRPFTATDFIAMGFKHVTEQPTPPTRLNPHLPAHIEQAVLTAMAKKREDRHADVAAFLKALQQPTQQTSDSEALQQTWVTTDLTDLNQLEACARKEGYWVCLEQVRAAREHAEQMKTGQAEELGRVECWLDRESRLLGHGPFWPNVIPGLFYQQLANRSVEEGHPLTAKQAPTRWVRQEGQVGAEDQSLLRIFAGHTHKVTSVAFSPDGKQVLTGSWDKTVRLWETTSGKLLRTLKGHTDRVTSVAFSPDGRQVLTGSGDKTARLWETTSGKLLSTLQGHTDRVTSVAFSPDGRLALTCDYDERVFLWRASGAEMGSLLGMYVATYGVGAVHWRDGSHVVLADTGGPEGRPHCYRLTLERM